MKSKILPALLKSLVALSEGYGRFLRFSQQSKILINEFLPEIRKRDDNFKWIKHRVFNEYFECLICSAGINNDNTALDIDKVGCYIPGANILFAGLMQESGTESTRCNACTLKIKSIKSAILKIQFSYPGFIVHRLLLCNTVIKVLISRCLLDFKLKILSIGKLKQTRNQKNVAAVFYLYVCLNQT